MTQSWHDLLFAHWPVDKRWLIGRIPPRLELDLYEGEAWLGIVPFRMTNVAPRGVPSIPAVSAFSELNVRTYVRSGTTPGVYFFSLDSSSTLSVVVARSLFNLPYYRAAIDVEADGPAVRYRSRRKNAPGVLLDATYQPRGDAAPAQPGSLAYFLTERYCLFTSHADAEPRRVDIHHRPWPLQHASASIDCNTLAEANSIVLPGCAPLLHFAKRQDVVAWLPTRAGCR